MKTTKLLHVLRNPYGRSDEERKQDRLAAADEIERWKDAFENMRDWAEQKGIDTNTPGKENLCLCPLHFGDCEYFVDGKCTSELI